MVLVSQMTYEAQLSKSNSLQIAATQNVLALKAVAGLHVPLELLAQSHRDWTSTLALPPPSINIGAGSLTDSCRSLAPKVQISPDISHTESSSLS